MSAAEITSVLQSASIKRHPDPRYDIAPSTSADKRQPVDIGSPTYSNLEAADTAGEDEIPVSVLDPRPRRPTLPPLPDLRFEQSYLKSIEKAEDWKGVMYITIRDQVFMPLIQGTVWSLVLSGWRHMNRASTLSGHNVGARIRRWWWQDWRSWSFWRKYEIKSGVHRRELRKFEDFYARTMGD